MAHPSSMQDPLLEFQKAKTLFDQAKTILIISHRRPDADAVGANLALREALENLGKKVNSACIDPPPQNCFFLKEVKQFYESIDPLKYDLIVSVDCGGNKLLGFQEDHPELLDPSKCTLINIDHHPSNDRFGTVNIVMDEAPATCFILYLMFNTYQWTITPSMATALLHGLYYDTGSFMHSNTNADVLRIAGRLKALGGKQELCVKTQFKNSSLAKLKLWGRALSRLYINQQGAAVSVITHQDYEETEANEEDLNGLVNLMDHAEEARFSLLLTEDFKGNVKGSMRTQNEEINLSKLAGLFGGGGHEKAAGFSVPGRLQSKRIWEIKPNEPAQSAHSPWTSSHSSQKHPSTLLS